MGELHILLRRYGLAAWRGRWFAIGLSWVICVGGWLFVSAVPNQYEASARLYVDSDAVLTPLLRGLALDNTPISQLDVLQRTLLSRPNLEKLISKTDLELTITGPADLEELVSSLGTAIKITPQTRNLFTIAYRNATPRLAYDVVQTILSIFIESKVGSSRTDMENARVFLQQQLASYERQLRAAEVKRADFHARYVDLLPSDATGISRLESARVQVRSLDGQLKDAAARREMIRKEMSVTPAALTIGSDATSMAESSGNAEIDRAEARLAELRLTFTEQHPDVIAARTLVASLRRGASLSGIAPSATAQDANSAQRTRARSIPNPIHEHMAMQLLEQDSAIASLQRQFTDAVKERDRLEDVARGMPGLQADLVNLNRDYDVLRRNYTEMLSRREAMRLAAAADSDAEKVKMQIVDPPQVPQVPVAPRRALLLSGVLVAGLGGGVGLAILLQQADRSFHAVEDLHDLELPVAGSISVLGATLPMRRRLLSVASFAMAVLLLCAVYGGLLYRLLRTAGAA
jgi:polysaccharide chain length determinant protein (PEP-CTERM system associated)